MGTPGSPPLNHAGETVPRGALSRRLTRIRRPWRPYCASTNKTADFSWPALSALKQNACSWVRLGSDNTGLGLTEAIDQANVRMQSMRPSVARSKAALIDSRKHRPAIPRIPAALQQCSETMHTAQKPGSRPSRQALQDAPVTSHRAGAEQRTAAFGTPTEIHPDGN